jgi:hypothetical protein|tara:strand:+ start:748 stop:1107 length:360 start_codon:yes stop_codon:yes gene_type:complete
MSNQNIEGTYEYDFAGKKRKFKLDFLALSSIETRMGMPMMKIATNMTNIQNIGVTNLAIILDEGLRCAGGKYTFQAVGDMILKNGFAETIKIISELIPKSMGLEEGTDNPLEEEKNQEK